MSKKSLPIACDMNAIPPEERDRHNALSNELFQAVISVRELPGGYAFQLPNGKDWLVKTALFVSNERFCCPFFEFTLQVEADNGPLWLNLTGSDGVKTFIEHEFRDVLSESLNVVHYGER